MARLVEVAHERHGAGRAQRRGRVPATRSARAPTTPRARAAGCACRHRRSRRSAGAVAAQASRVSGASAWGRERLQGLAYHRVLPGFGLRLGQTPAHSTACAARPRRIMTFNVTLQPANRQFTVERDEAILPAAIRQGIGLPYGCRDGACGSCKSKLLEGRVIHGAHQLQARCRWPKRRPATSSPAAPRRRPTAWSRRACVPGAGEYPVLKLPSRVLGIERVGARRDRAAPAAAGQPEPAVPRRAVRRVHPARRRAAQLQHGQCAAQPGQPAGHRTARAPHARRQVHRPCLRRR